jgi:hypothetical protein
LIVVLGYKQLRLTLPRSCAPGIASVPPPPECVHHDRIYWCWQCSISSPVADDTKLRLILETDKWLAAVDDIRQGHCNIKHLCLDMLLITRSKDTEAFKAIASAIRLDRSLESLDLDLQMMNGFTNEAGMALVEAFAVNKTLRKITLSLDFLRPSRQVQDTDVLSASVYEAFNAMLRVNTSVVLKLILPFEIIAGADEKLVDSRNQMRIERGLNHVGRGKLFSSSQTTREEWINALDELIPSDVDESSEFTVSFLNSLLRLNPSSSAFTICSIEPGHLHGTKPIKRVVSIRQPTL